VRGAEYGPSGESSRVSPLPCGADCIRSANGVGDQNLPQASLLTDFFSPARPLPLRNLGGMIRHIDQCSRKSYLFIACLRNSRGELPVNFVKVLEK
jgi:hypothetical protein